MTTTDVARVTDEEIARMVEFCRSASDIRVTCTSWAPVIVALADRLAARDAELAAVRREVERFKILAENEATFNQNCRDTIAKLRAERAEVLALLARGRFSDAEEMLLKKVTP